MEIYTDPYTAAVGAHAVVVMTEWDEFTTYDYARIYDTMAKPACIFDGRVLLDHSMLANIGFRVHCVGIRGMQLRSSSPPLPSPQTVSMSCPHGCRQKRHRHSAR